MSQLPNFEPIFIDVGGNGQFTYTEQIGSAELNDDNVLTLRGRITGTVSDGSGKLSVGNLPMSPVADGDDCDAPGCVTYQGLTLDAGYTQICILPDLGNACTAHLAENGSGLNSSKVATPRSGQIVLIFGMVYRATNS